MIPRCPLRAQTATAETPPTPTTTRVTWRRTDLGSTYPNTRTTLCPDRVIGTTSCQVSRTVTCHLRNNVRMSDASVCFKLRLLLCRSSEYVNQEIQHPRPGILERPTTLPRKGSRADRRLPNGLSSGHSVENPGYLIPFTARTPTSPAFDNPYYLDHLAKARTGAGASEVLDSEALEAGGAMPRHVNGFVTPTAENPEYLGLADTLSGHT